LKKADIGRSRKILRSHPLSMLQLFRILDKNENYRFNSVHCDRRATAAIFEHSPREIILFEP